MGHLKEVLCVIVRFRVIERGDVNWHDGVHNIFGIYSKYSFVYSAFELILIMQG